MAARKKFEELENVENLGLEVPPDEYAPDPNQDYQIF